MKNSLCKVLTSLAMFGLLLPTLSFAQAPPNRLGQIIASQNLRVCIWPDYYSISYRDPREYKLSGVDIDLAYELAADLGVRLSFIDSSFGKLVPDLLNNHCDVAMFAVGVTELRKKHVRFTSPHLFSDVLGITTKANRKIQSWADIDQPDVVVSVAKGTFHEPLMREKLKHAKLLVRSEPLARELDLESGRADIFMTDFPYSQRLLNTTEWARLVAPPSDYHLTYYAWALAPGDDVWFDRLQRFVANIKKDGRLMKAAKKYGLESIVVLE